MTTEIRPLGEHERPWVGELIRERWGDEIVVAHGVVYRPAELFGFVGPFERAPSWRHGS